MSQIKIQTTLPSLVFSCHFPTVIRVTTDMSTLSFVLKNAKTQAEIISLTLDAYNGFIEIYDIRTVIEQYMRDNGIVYAKLTLESEHIDEGDVYTFDSITFGVLYSSHSMSCSAKEYTERFFLSTIQQKLTYPTVEEEISYFTPSSQTIRIDYIIIVDDGELQRPIYKSEEVTVNEGLHSLWVSYNGIAKKADIDTAKYIILSASVSIGERDFTLFYSQSAPSIDFYFRNMFNIFEHCPISAKTICKTNTERSVASINGISSFYDQKDSQENAIETQPLSQGLAQWLAQLCISPSVYMSPGVVEDIGKGNFGNASQSDGVQYSSSGSQGTKTNQEEQVQRCGTEMKEILITESTVEVSDDNEELNVVKFTWKEIDGKPSYSVPEYKSSVYNPVFNKTYK